MEETPMSTLFGTPHFEIVARHGYRETLLGRRTTRGEAESLRHDYAALYEYIFIRQVEL
jgi:hypothetical protein